MLCLYAKVLGRERNLLLSWPSVGICLEKVTGKASNMFLNAFVKVNN